jgi:segregation and condensation protein A
MPDFTVKTKEFEGPLDLLLSLIEKRKLFINDISLAKVADDFIAYVRSFESLPMGDAAHFILVASTLLLIKSKSLLPNLSLTEEEEGDIRDLEIRLKIYQRIKEASRNIKDSYGTNPIFEPSKDRPMTPVFSPHTSMNPAQLLSSIKNLLRSLPKKEVLPKALVRKVVSLEEMITKLTTRVTSGLRMSFKDFSGEHKGEKVNIIVSFLAMLELVKQGVIHVNQESHFGDIHMESKEVGVPRYN